MISTTFSKVTRIEFDFTPDRSDILYSFLQLRIYTPESPYPHKLIFFPANATSACDYLHNIYLGALGAGLHCNPAPKEELANEPL